MNVVEVYDKGGNHRLRIIPKEIAVAQQAIKYNHRFYSTSHHDNYVNPGPPVATIDSAATVNNAIADGVATNTVTFTAKASGGAPVPNAVLMLSETGDAIISPPDAGQCNGSGVLTVTAVSSVVGDATITATAFGGATKGQVVTFVAPPAPPAAMEAPNASTPSPTPTPAPTEEPEPAPAPSPAPAPTPYTSAE